MYFYIKNFIKEIIICDKYIKHYYNKTYSNTKYTLDQIIDDIIYILKMGISWRNLRSSIKWQSVYFYYQRFVNNDIFLKISLLIQHLL